MTAVEALIATTRFGLGARPGELGRIGDGGRAWLDRALAETPVLPAALAGQPPSRETVALIVAARREPARLQQLGQERLLPLYRAEAAARTLAAIDSSQPVIERLTQFWSNHFTISARGKPLLGALGGAYEREAIRPHVLGRFADLLEAAVLHPGMLLYLDNAGSAGPGSAAGRGTQRGLNENLAREVLELHTLGVDGGYGQDDVGALARILTGWSLAEDGSQRFRPALHEPGPKTLVGRRYAEAGGDEARQALAGLARHPSTARHIATKLARHFLADDPPPAAVADLAHRFQESDGNLGQVMAALAARPETWAAPQPKIKTPNDLVVSTLRALGGHRGPQEALLRSLAALDQAPFAAPSPAGWPDEAAGWIGPEAMLKRIEWAQQLARRLAPAESAVALAEDVVGPVLRAATRDALAQAPTPADSLALLIAAPEFQRR